MKNRKVRYVINSLLGLGMLAGAVTVVVFLLRSGDTGQSGADSNTEGTAAYEWVKDPVEGDLQTEFWGADHIFP